MRGQEGETMEYERVREEIAKWLHSYIVKERKEHISWLEIMQWEELSQDTRQRWCERANEILSIDGVRVEAKDQSLPHDKLLYIHMGDIADEARARMLKPDSEGKVWIKVEPKGGKK